MKILAIFFMFTLWQCKTTTDSGSVTKDLADGSNWCHVRFQSSDGVKVSIDYQVYTDFHAGLEEANPLWVNVEKNGLGSQDSVHFILVAKDYQDGKEKEDAIKSIDLHWSPNENRFTGEVNGGMVLKAHGKNIIGHEFAFRVNNQWQKDQHSHSNNFKSNLSDINWANNYTCHNPNSVAPKALDVRDWRALPSQQEIDDLVSKPLNDSAHPYTDYRANAALAHIDLPGESILAAMRRSQQKFETGRNEKSYGNLTSCLTTGYSPKHWPDIAIHYYCLMNEPRQCYTYSTSGQISRVNSFKGCTGNYPGPGNFPHQSYVASFDFVKNDQPIEFQYVMFAQTYAYKQEQEQAIINTFWGVQNPFDTTECIQKRPRRSEDPTDGTHCRPDKVMRSRLTGRGR